MLSTIDINLKFLIQHFKYKNSLTIKYTGYRYMPIVSTAIVIKYLGI